MTKGVTAAMSPQLSLTTCRRCYRREAIDPWRGILICEPCNDRTRDRYIERSSRFDERDLCSSYMNKLRLRGLLVAPSRCEVCGAAARPDTKGRAYIHGHHTDGYEPRSWLKLLWCCARCHRHEHERLAQQGAAR